jgi:hypothetical protein
MLGFNYQLQDYLGIDSWGAKNTITPFVFDNIHINPLCIAILPFADQDFNQKSSAEQKLFAKMLTVLELPARQLMPGLLITNEDSPINQLQLTEKILFFNPKLILGFGECNYLDIALLESNNIIVMNTIHPRNLLQDPKLKKLAYQDLLLCKQKLASIS